MRRAIVVQTHLFFDADDDDDRVEALIKAAGEHAQITSRICGSNFGVVGARLSVESFEGADAKQLEHQQQCPFCGSTDIEGSVFDGEGHQVWQNVSCAECNEEWQEIYHRAATDITRAGEIDRSQKPSTTTVD